MDPGSWSGTPPMSVSYQWQSCDQSGNNCANVAGATQSLYQLGPGDVGTTLVVVVTASNAGGSTSVASSPSAVVVAAPPSNVVAPSVGGSAEDGQTLSASPGSWSGTPPLSYSYQWQSCDPTGNNCANVTGATGPTYQLSPGDVGTTLVVVVTVTNGEGSSSAASAPSGVVAPAPPANTLAPSVSGTAQDGQTLTANVGSWSGTPALSYSYQWQSCDQSGNNCANVAGATQPTYQLGLGDVGTTLQVVVTASNSVGSSDAVSVVTPVVIAIPPFNAYPPSISGTVQIGQTLSAGSTGMWTGDPVTAYSYQWQNCDPTGNNCWAIAGATGPSYQVPAWESNETVELTVTASNSGGSASASSLVTQPVGGTAPQAPVYFQSSIFAQPIPANAPLDPQSSQMAQQLTNLAFGVAPTETYNCRQSVYIPWTQWNSAQETYCHQVNSRADFDDNAYSPTLYIVPAGQPTVTVQIPSNPNLQAAMQAVPIPSGAYPAPGTDGQMIVYQPSSDTMWEFWRAYQSNGQWYASAGGRIPHVSTNVGYYQNIPNTNNSCSTNPQVKYCEQSSWGGSAAGIPLLTGLTTIPQLQSGQIDHAVLLALPDNAANVWSWPAQHSDGTGDSIIPEGAWFRVNPNVNIDAWFASLNRPIAPIERMLAQAMQTYGAVVVNRSTSVTVGSENWTVSGNDVFDGPGGLFGGLSPTQFMTDLPWEDMQVLQTNMCNAIQPGSPLYQTPCNPPQYITPNPNPPANNPCPPPLSVTPQAGQTAGPSITFTSPTWLYMGPRVPYSAAVTDPSGVTHVDFKVDGQLRFVSTYPFCQKYVFGGQGGFWDAESEPAYGWHTLEVDAYDSLGHESTASEMVIGGGSYGSGG
ncbi:hypothetical protein [Mycobacterium sp.]|uniref:hypothetical protein n=1 Tax=Mycobacterium sp. TaxID=1785 RepID=UPI002D76A0AE|nr:hypothetical protein [Mycobacterium sp.]